MVTDDKLTEKVIGLCIQIHNQPGVGLFESVYETVLCFELGAAGIQYESQVPIPVFYKEVKMDVGFRADIIINRQLLLEIKSIEHVAPVHKKQVLTYLSLASIPIGLLINFNTGLLKDGITRLFNKNFARK